jgi:hypothetical protein
VVDLDGFKLHIRIKGEWLPNLCLAENGRERAVLVKDALGIESVALGQRAEKPCQDDLPNVMELDFGGHDSFRLTCFSRALAHAISEMRTLIPLGTLTPPHQIKWWDYRQEKNFVSFFPVFPLPQ